MYFELTVAHLFVLFFQSELLTPLRMIMLTVSVSPMLVRWIPLLAECCPMSISIFYAIETFLPEQAGTFIARVGKYMANK